MQAGFFETDITPPVGTEQAGGYGKMLVQSIHDPKAAGNGQVPAVAALAWRILTGTFD